MDDQEKSLWKVCVRCFTYNHLPYIVNTMDGFCSQETNFPFVCTIVDDASTDGEPEVIKRYLEDNFNMNDHSIVRNEEYEDYFLTYAQHKSNKNCFFAVLFLKYNHYLKKSKGPYLKEWMDYAKYIAICEGDDYWIDSNKLQYQSEFLDAHPDYGLVYTKAKAFIQDTGRMWNEIGKTCDFKTLLFEHGIPTLTALYRKEALEGYGAFINGKKWLLGDKPLWLFISLKYKLHFENRVTGVYRILNNSAMCRNSYEERSRFYDSSYDVSLYYAEKFCPELLPILHKSRDITQMKVAYSYSEYDKVIYFYKKIRHPGIKMTIKYLLSLLKKHLNFIHLSI